ncbi:MAG: hypothetical protein LKJ88_01260 [Bacilli bacterium]|nr:hypothetical protein [Bacilli bacterium]
MKKTSTIYYLLSYLGFALSLFFISAPLNFFIPSLGGGKYTTEGFIFLGVMLLPLFICGFFSARFVLHVYPTLEDKDEKISRLVLLIISLLGISSAGIFIGNIEYIPFICALVISAIIYPSVIFLSLKKEKTKESHWKENNKDIILSGIAYPLFLASAFFTLVPFWAIGINSHVSSSFDLAYVIKPVLAIVAILAGIVFYQKYLKRINEYSDQEKMPIRILAIISVVGVTWVAGLYSVSVGFYLLALAIMLVWSSVNGLVLYKA